jgi:uncharacterized small protein (DUF1192 family)
MRIITAVVLTALVWPVAAQTIQVVGENVGVGTGTPGAKLDVAGNGRFSSTLIATSLSDYNNGAYLLDPNGTSRLSTVWADRVVVESGTTGNSGIANSTGSLGSAEMKSNGPGAAMIAFHRPGYYAAYLGLDTDNRWKVGGWSMGADAFPLLLMNRWNGSIYAHDDGRIYCNVLYDNNNVNYVVDPNGTSRFNTVWLNIVDGPNVGYNSGITNPGPYAWGYQEAGAWTSPYPDLVFGFHTGMKFGANTGYGGMKFYSDHPSISSTVLFSVGDGDGHVRVANNLYAGAQVQAASFRSTSSRRWKNNIRPMRDALTTVRRLQGVTYRWNHYTNPDTPDDVGFIAEEVDLVVPQIVGHDAEGLPDSVDYGRLTALLVEAVKETDQRQAAMSSELETLRAELAAFREQRREPAQSQTHQVFLVAAGLAIAFTLGRRARPRD